MRDAHGMTWMRHRLYTHAQQRRPYAGADAQHSPQRAAVDATAFTGIEIQCTRRRSVDSNRRLTSHASIVNKPRRSSLR